MLLFLYILYPKPFLAIEYLQHSLISNLIGSDAIVCNTKRGKQKFTVLYVMFHLKKKLLIS